jgi:hypothetical protein
MTAEPPSRVVSLFSPSNDMTLSFGRMLMPSVFREYILGDKGENSCLVWCDWGVRRTGVICASPVNESDIGSLLGEDSTPALGVLVLTMSAPESVRLQGRSTMGICATSSGVFHRSSDLATRFSICSAVGVPIVEICESRVAGRLQTLFSIHAREENAQ